MYNLNNDSASITKAYNSGLISKTDYDYYNQICDSKQMLKKGHDEGILPDVIYNNVVSTLEFAFVREIKSGKLQFKLHTNAKIVPPEKRLSRKK